MRIVKRRCFSVIIAYKTLFLHKALDTKLHKTDKNKSSRTSQLYNISGIGSTASYFNFPRREKKKLKRALKGGSHQDVSATEGVAFGDKFHDIYSVLGVCYS